MAGEGVGVAGGVDEEEAVSGDAQVEPGEQVGVLGVGDDELAVGVGDVVGQLGSSTGRVDAHDGCARQPGGDDPEQVLGGVVEQHTDVERPVAPAVECERPASGALVDHLVPRPAVVLEHQARVIVADPLEQQAGSGGNGVGHGSPQ